MGNWDKISLGQFQQIDAVNSRTDIDDIDKVLFSVCVLNNMTEHELDSVPKKAVKMAAKVSSIFTTPFNPEPYEKIGKYKVNYNPETMRFGQYIELAFYMSENHIKNAHKIIASITDEPVKNKWKKVYVNDSEKHADKADFFLSQPVTKIIGSLKRFQEMFEAFNKKYSWLFGLDKDTHGSEAKGARFNKVYGWWYAAETIAKYKRIPLDEAYALNVADAFSSLGYLKEKQKYESELLKQRSNGR